MLVEIAKKMLVSPWPYRMVRLGLGVLFVWAGVTKLRDPEAFAKIISTYELVPEVLIVPISFGLPGLEIIGGLGLIFDLRGSLSVIFCLLVMFVLVLWFGILKDLDLDCGCFSPADLKEHGALRAAMLRDLGMMAAVAYLFWWRRSAVVRSPKCMDM